MSPPAFFLLAALAAQPSGAPAPVTHGTAVAATPAIPDEDVRLFAAIAGRKVAGRPVSGPYPTADKILILSRDDRGNPEIGASFAISARQSLPPPPQGTLAVVRLHQRSETTIPGPTPDDLAFVAANKLPLFVIGEWARPAPMWEVAWVDDAVRYRNIGEVGEIGPWQD
ncbi:hypothetical protein [Sphingopyxis sp.]|jgi:hypothetical protein|uniref:hypothetical protein n=1 Tax=Sphingopyxis sp. TaxID=1908224 RepID=UPI002E08FAEC|nr:hypothetical protein [Sphingopyxis sp.]